MTLFEKTEQFVKHAFENASKHHSIAHLLRTAHWAKVLRPDADEAILIAAITHDIERPFRSEEDQESINQFWRENGFKGKEFIENHQKKGGKIMADFLKRQNADQSLIDRVTHMVAHHEFGGDPDSDLIKDADSLSFFENNAERFIAGKFMSSFGKQKVKEKLKWMYERISDPKAKEIARPYYEKFSSKL